MGVPLPHLFHFPIDDVTIKITACDIDSAILARNIFLLSYIVKHQERLEQAAASDDELLDNLWSIYYHFFLTGDALDLLQRHALELASASVSLEDWNSSLYGDTFGFISKTTLVEVSSFWRNYVDTSGSFGAGQNEKDARKTISDINTKHVRDTISITGFCSAGIHGMKSIRVFSECFQAYWATGVIAGNHKDREALGAARGGTVHPLLAFSSSPFDGFCVHYGSDPLLGFHLAPVFDTDDFNRETLAELAKAQFRSWSRAFARYVKANAIKIEVHHGDAVNLCYKLQKNPSLASTTSTYVRPWSAKPLVLDFTACEEAGPCHSYDVIDMSNLLDHVGLLNLLPAAVPLLLMSPQSVMYTESLLVAAEDPSQSLQALLRSDITTLSLMLGVAPVGHLVGVTDYASGLEDFMFASSNGNLGQKSQ